jgi:hypothetical protein
VPSHILANGSAQTLIFCLDGPKSSLGYWNRQRMSLQKGQESTLEGEVKQAQYPACRSRPVHSMNSLDGHWRLLTLPRAKLLANTMKRAD